jgi:hypothetical protein
LFVMAFSLALASPLLAHAQNGQVTGKVTNSASGAGVPGGSLRFCTAAEVCFNTVNTDANGDYTISLAPGTYYAFTVTFNTLGFINEIYNDLLCPVTCDPAAAIGTGTAIVVTSGGAVSGRNFALAPGGSITGRVSGLGGAPLAGVTVSIRMRDGTVNRFVPSVSTSAAGTFTVPGLPTGTFYAYTSNTLGYADEIFDNVLCLGNCSVSLAFDSGSAIAVTAGAERAGVDFALSQGGAITGIVTNAATSSPMSGVFVRAVARFGTGTVSARSGSTNASGIFNLSGLPAGTYFLQTSTSAAVNENYNNLPCPHPCDLSAALLGEPIVVAAGATVANRDFQLDPGGSISGTITAAATGQVLSSIGVQVHRQTASGGTQFVIGTGTGTTTGTYTLAGLQAGTYYVVAVDLREPIQFAGRVLGGDPCVICNVLAGTPIVVSAGTPTTGHDIALIRGATISGTVTDAASGAPVVGLVVNGYSSAGLAMSATGSFGFTGNSYVIGGLPAGTYYASTSGARFHLNEIFNDVPCPGGTCTQAATIATGTPITVAAGATAPNVNFALTPRNDPPGAPQNFSVTALGFGAQMSWSPPTSGGLATSYVVEAGLTPGGTVVSLPSATTSLSVPGVPSGTFYLRVRGVNAVGTGPASAEFTLVVNADGAATPRPPTGLVAWMSEGRLTMTWTQPSSGPVPTAYRVEAGSAAGASNLATIVVNTRSFVFDPVPQGFFFLRVRSIYGANVSTPSAEVMINVGNVPAPPSPPQSLTHTVSGSTVTFTWSAPAIGTATSYILEAGSASGLSDLAVLNTGSTATTRAVPSVPRGTYYVRLRAVNAQGASPVSNERTVVVP